MEMKHYVLVMFSSQKQIGFIFLLFLDFVLYLYLKMDLTEKQLTLWRELGSNLAAPPHICQQALKFYQTYKLSQSWITQKADLVFRVGYFLAEKAQVLYDGQGRKLKSVAISANSILRDQPKHQQFLYHLREMLRSIIIPSQASHLEEEVALFSKQLSFALTFLNKLKATLKKFRINRKGEEPNDYEQLITRFIWLLFIDSRADLKIGNDIVQSTCLLSGILGCFLSEKYKEEGIYSIYLEQDNQGCTLPNEIQQLSIVLMNYFHIKDSNTYFGTSKKFLKYLQKLEKNIGTNKMFQYQNLSKNVYVIQKIYEKKLTEDKLDQSTFLREASLSNKPIKLTPFGRRAPLAPKVAPALSHKILNFQNWQQGQQNKSSIEKRKEDKGQISYFSKMKFQQTPKGTLIRATPMSEAMQLYNWLFDKSGRFTLKKQQYQTIQDFFEICVSNQSQYHSNSDHCQLAGGLWKENMQKFNDLSVRGLLLVAVHITCHILNATTNNIKMVIPRLQLRPYEVWEVLDQLINNYDKNMPIGLKLNLLALQNTLVSNLLWSDRSNLELIQTSITKSISGRLVKRVIHQGAYTLHFLAKKLEANQDVQDTSFMIFQQTLQNCQSLLYERWLQHILVCSLYAAFKVKDCSIKFNQILAALKQILGMASSPFEELVEAVKTAEKRQNIITFYNTQFIPAIRSFLRHIRSLNGFESSPLVPNTKVRDLVAKEASSLSSPQMVNYFAYCQSPMLKGRSLRQISINTNLAGGTIRREATYGLQDIQAKCKLKFSQLVDAAAMRQKRLARQNTDLFNLCQQYQNETTTYK